MERSVVKERTAYRKVRERFARINEVYRSPPPPSFYDFMHAIEYASAQKKLAGITGDSEERDRWGIALDNALQEGEEDLDLLRLELQKEAEIIEEAGKEGSTEAATAFRNLADSI